MSFKNYDWTLNYKEGKDWTYDVYVKLDSSKGHSHDRVGLDENLLDKYHDCLLSIYIYDRAIRIKWAKRKKLQVWKLNN